MTNIRSAEICKSEREKHIRLLKCRAGLARRNVGLRFVIAINEFSTLMERQKLMKRFYSLKRIGFAELSFNYGLNHFSPPIFARFIFFIIISGAVGCLVRLVRATVHV